MRKGNNLVFELLRGNASSPVGWGFPPASPHLKQLSPLRDLLMFISDEDGQAQLIRWYFSMIRSFPGVWRQVAGDEEGYLPSMMFKPCLESPSLNFKRDTRSGAMFCGWVPGVETTSLTGTLSERQFVLGGVTYPVQVLESDEGELRNLVFPDKFQIQAAVSGLETELEHSVIIRPRSFDAWSVARRVQDSGFQHLSDANLLSQFLALPRVEDKLAVAWLAVLILESAHE